MFATLRVTVSFGESDTTPIKPFSKEIIISKRALLQFRKASTRHTGSATTLVHRRVPNKPVSIEPAAGTEQTTNNNNGSVFRVHVVPLCKEKCKNRTDDLQIGQCNQCRHLRFACIINCRYIRSVHTSPPS